MPIGSFRIIKSSTDPSLFLLTFGPCDVAEAQAGCPHAAFALWTPDKMVRDDAKLEAFLNAAVAASHGNSEALIKLCDRKRAA